MARLRQDERQQQPANSSNGATDVTACIFPAIAGRYMHAIKFDEYVVCALRSLPLQDTAGIHLALSSVWAIALRRFAECDTPRFGIRIRLDASNKSKRHVYSALVDVARPVSSLFDEKNWEICNNTAYQDDSFNTEIIVLSVPDGDANPPGVYDCDVNLVLCLNQRPAELTLVHSSSHLSETYARYLVSGISHAIISLAENPTQLIDEVDMCCPTQKAQVLSWQLTTLTQPTEFFLFQHVDRQADRNQDGLAVDSWDGRLTYHELKDMTDRIAKYLQAHGVRSGIMVPVSFEKSFWAIAAMLAVNKAGGAFVPCDPAYPESRLRTILEKTKARIVLTSAQNAPLFSSFAVTTIVISTTTIAQLAPSNDAPLLPASPVAPAYCLFTSGSTGEPKGCQVSHLALAAISEQIDALHLSGRSRSLQFASFCFGVSLIEVWCTLIAGGTIFVPSEHTRLHSLEEYLVTNRLNWALLTPTVLGSLDPASIEDMNLLIAGEAMEEDNIITWAPKVHLYQAYGLTEWAGIFAVSQRVTSSQDRGNIGFPVNGRAWVVDPSDDSKLAPIGAVGELLIEGPSLAHGYLDDADGSQQGFLSRPSWSLIPANSGDHRQVYKTGDLVRYGEDGSIRYVRRKDNQVKIRGQRLEAGEVEYNIRQLLPSAKRVIAVVHSSPKDRVLKQNLVAFTLLPALNLDQKMPSLSHGGLHFLEVDSDYRAQVLELRKRLQSRLPAFMIPQLFLPVSSIPTTITGKIDRRSLCQEANKLSYDELYRLAGLAVETRAPRNELEEAVHQSIGEVLGLAQGQFGMLDNFFHLGGNSALAVKLAVALKRRGLEVSITDTFNNPVLADLALVASQRDRAESEQSNGLELTDKNQLHDLKKVAMEQCNLRADQIENIYPATPLQAAMIAMTSRSPQLCQARITCELCPEVDIEAFKAAWERVFQLNDILRTRFIVSPSHGTMQVVTMGDFQWAQVNGMSDHACQVDLLAMGVGKNLVHAYLAPNICEGQTTWSFVIVMHHALCDQWSIHLLLEQVAAAYKNLPVSHHSFIPFTKYLSERQPYFEEYWINQFENLKAVVFPNLPSPHYIPAASEELVYMMSLPGRSTKSYTMASYLKLAWALVMSYNTGSDDVVFGVTVNGRGAAVDGIAEVVGPTLATVPQRIKLATDDSVVMKLSEIQIQSMKSIPFEQAGLQHIQKYSPETRRACMFQSQLIIQPPSQDPPGLFRVCKFAATAIGGFSAYGLSVECLTTCDDRECKIRVTFDPVMISRERAQRLVQHMELVLQSLLENTCQKLGDVPRVTPQDWDQLQQWNGDVPSASTECVHDVIRKRFLATPNAPAISAADGSFSYSELMELSDKLAVHIHLQGVTCGMFVPLLFEKSKWTTVAILGVLKAGGAFALLDQSLPLHRLQTICSDINSRCLICSKSQVDRAKKLAKKVLCVHDTAKIWENGISMSHLPEVQPNDPLYLVFTSGSTGNPKGIIIDHKSYCSSSQAHNKAHLIGQSSRVLQFASYAFDVSIMETLSTLMAGGCICILSDSERRDNFAGMVQEYGVTHAFLTPSATRLLKHQDITSLRVIVMGGEVMSPADSSYWVNKVQLMNEYGTAECCVASTLRHITKADQQMNDIGFPLGLAAWVTDPTDHNRLVPIGAVGELLLEGPGIGLGYLNNPEATRRVFIEPPAWLAALRQGRSTRVYKTGDLVHYNDDGSLLFLGRKDAQTKVRGQRFELEEVEYHIRGFQEVLEVAAVVASPSGGKAEPRLAAFITQTEANNEINSQKSTCTSVVSPTDDFRRLSGVVNTGLHSVLPDYMVPTIYLPVISMPKTDSGKVDRQKLKEVVEQHTWDELVSFDASTISKETPSTDIERKLQATWAHVLGITSDSIGVNDSFFTLGGDSISAMQVVAQARSQSLEYSTHDIMRLKTIAAIANKAIVTSTSQPVAQEEWTNGLFDLSPIQTFFFDKYPEGTNQFNQNMLIHVQQQVASADIERAVARLVKHHSMLRARYVQKGNGVWKQFIASYTKDCFKLRSHHVSSGREMQQIIKGSQSSLDIKTGPVFTVDLFELGGKKCLFMIGHHLVIDLVSWRIILADLDAMLRDRQRELCPAMSFQVWSQLQAEYAHSHLEPADIYLLPYMDADFMRKFWGAADNLNLLGDTESKLIRLNEEMTNTIFTASSNALGVEPVELLHAALLFSFVQTFPHRPAPCIYAEAHGREPWEPSIDITRTVGWFTTLWPVVVQTEASHDMQTVVQKVKEARRRKTNNGWDYFTSIYENTQNKRQSADMPLIEITFNYAGKFQQAEQADALLRMEPMSKQSLFDGAKELDRWAMFEINSVIFGGCLEFHVTYNTGLSKEEVLTPWMDSLISCLRVLATEFR